MLHLFTLPLFITVNSLLNNITRIKLLFYCKSYLQNSTRLWKSLRHAIRMEMITVWYTNHTTLTNITFPWNLSWVCAGDFNSPQSYQGEGQESLVTPINDLTSSLRELLLQHYRRRSRSSIYLATEHGSYHAWRWEVVFKRTNNFDFVTSRQELLYISLVNFKFIRELFEISNYN